MGNAQGRIYFTSERRVNELGQIANEGVLTKFYRAVIWREDGKGLLWQTGSDNRSHGLDADPAEAYTKMREAALKLGTVVDLHRWGADGNTFAETVPF